MVSDPAGRAADGVREGLQGQPEDGARVPALAVTVPAAAMDAVPAAETTAVPRESRPPVPRLDQGPRNNGGAGGAGDWLRDQIAGRG